MSRPTRYCKTCGEYIADGTRWIARTRTSVPCLIHIDADGRKIDRAHAPIEDTRA